MTNKIYVVGVTYDDLHELQQLPVEVINHCALFISGEKHHHILKIYQTQICPVTPLKETLQEIESALNRGNVIVLGSGDPLFYGIGSTLLKTFRQENLVFFPALTSIQRACSRFKLSWHDAKIISLHGRSHPHLAGLFLSQAKSLVLTDNKNTPAKIASDILEYLKLIDYLEMGEEFQCMVAENLGTDKERIFTGSLKETASQESFSPLNVFALVNNKYEAVSRSFGLSEQEIQHSRGLITKSEVRAAAIHQLCLPKKGILWDIGGGSGSISIEAARLFPELVIYCVEQKEEELANIKANIRKFDCFNVIPVHDNAVNCITHLPPPDRVFVGGSSGLLAEIINISAEKLPQNGRIVVNSVLEKTAREAPKQMTKHDLQVSSTTISVCRNKGTENELQLNPITITTGIKHE